MYLIIIAYIILLRDLVFTRLCPPKRLLMLVMSVLIHADVWWGFLGVLIVKFTPDYEIRELVFPAVIGGVIWVIAGIQQGYWHADPPVRWMADVFGLMYVMIATVMIRAYRELWWCAERRSRVDELYLFLYGVCAAVYACSLFGTGAVGPAEMFAECTTILFVAYLGMLCSRGGVPGLLILGIIANHKYIERCFMR